MQFRVAQAARVTGTMLERLVREKLQEDHIPEVDCVICYGAGYSGALPSLNATCSTSNKMTQGQALSAALGSEALPIFVGRPPVRPSPTQTFIARKIKHSKGRDMIVCDSPRRLTIALERGRDYFTPLVDSDTEYRVWVYRKRILAVYEKRLTEAANNHKFGRNRANGYTFHQLKKDRIPEGVRRVAVAAVSSLNLDFGAVDILGKKGTSSLDITPTVLEVNSAPGVSDEHRSAIVKLTHRIVRWIANGCPARTPVERN